MVIKLLSRNSEPVLQIDGRRLYYSFIAGTKKILDNQAELNRINVFPVNDGDTGSNMAATVRSVFDIVQPHRSYKITIDRIAETAMTNARGNSGIIFAQLLYGISNETGQYQSVNFNQFAGSIKNSVRYIYEAVAVPVEGTMLTVISDWADYIYSRRNEYGDFVQMLASSVEVLEKSLEETRHKLAVLARAKVVDAGASGFVFFIRGIVDFLRSRNIRNILGSKTEIQQVHSEDIHIPEHINLRYCTEAILRQVTASQQTLAQLLSRHGDSAVIAGSDAVKHLHLHTNDPAAFFYQLKNYGNITFQKADDMVRQSETVYRRKWKIALVTDSTCDLPREMIDHYQINMVPISISFGENHYLDKITIQPEQFYSLLDESPDFPKTAQINEQTFVNLYSQLATHYDSIIAVHLTSRFSGTYFNSVKAGESIGREFGKPVTVIDSKNLSGALGLIILRIAKAIEEGLTHEQIVNLTENWIHNTHILVSVKTIKYMVRGGRVSHLRGLIARILNVNPIISMDTDGKSMVFGKTFSQQANMEKVMDHIRELLQKHRIWNYIVLHAANPEAAAWYANSMKFYSGLDPVASVNISPVIGANTGVGAASIALMVD
jgi:DegV family protein with EDD domain